MSRIQRLRLRLSLVATDAVQRLRNSTLLTKTLARLALLLATVSLSREWQARWHFRAARLTQSASVGAVLKNALRFYTTDEGGRWLRESRFGLASYDADLSRRPPGFATSSLVLKPCVSPEEKGVVLCSFEYNLAHLLSAPGLSRFLEDYVLVGFSSWSPTNFAVASAYSGLSNDPLWLSISNASDVHAYNAFAPTVKALDLMASDWVNPELYQPRRLDDRDIDLLMVANFLPFKRHWLLFRALRHMDPRLRVVIVGEASPGRDAAAIFREAEAFGVRQPLDVISDVRRELMPELQCRAKVAVLCSAREGANVASAEALFADAPIALMAGSHVGAMKYVNPETGVLLRQGRMHRDLEALLERRGRLRPRAWALANISCVSSSDRLNASLRAHAAAAGRPWTRDLAPIYCQAFAPRYLHATDRDQLMPIAAEVRERFGIEFSLGSRARTSAPA